jgi:hypothetical protein
MALLKINGVDMPTPSTMSVAVEDLVHAERNARGKMIDELIAIKDKIELTWAYLTPVQLSQLLTAVKPRSFNVTYMDPVTNSLKTTACYSGPKTAPIMDYINGVLRYKDVRLNLIER